MKNKRLSRKQSTAKIKELEKELEIAKRKIEVLDNHSLVKKFKPLKFSNAELYSSIRNMPAWHYFHFSMYFRLFEASSGQIMADIRQGLDSFTTRLQNALNLDLDKEVLVNDIKEIIKGVENKKVGYFSVLQGTNYFYFAMACLIYKLDNNVVETSLTNENELFALVSFIDNIGSLQIIEEIRRYSDTFNDQLIKNFPDIFKETAEEEVTEFKKLKNEILSIDILDESEQATQFNEEVIYRIHRIFYNRSQNIIVNTNNPEDYATNFLGIVTEHYQALGYNEKDLKQISIYEFYAKHRKVKTDADRLKQAQEKQQS